MNSTTNNALKFLKTTTLAVLLAIGTLSMAGCEQDGPMEEAGEKLDRAADDVGNAAEDAGDELEDAADELQ
ncbi:MAG: hypothetical protein RJQ07_10635 [Pseudomonadales bacterium]